MSNRERWILYPLLLLALGSSLRDKLLQRVDTRAFVGQDLEVSQAKVNDLGASGTIACNKLLVRQAIELREQTGGPGLQLVIQPSGGGIYIRNAQGKEVIALGVDPSAGVGIIQTKDDQERPRVTLACIDDGGAVLTDAGDSQNLLAMEHDGQGNGVISIYDAEGKRYVVLRAGPMPAIRDAAPQPITDPNTTPAGESPDGTQATEPAPVEPAATTPAEPQ